MNPDPSSPSVRLTARGRRVLAIAVLLLVLLFVNLLRGCLRGDDKAVPAPEQSSAAASATTSPTPTASPSPSTRPHDDSDQPADTDGMVRTGLLGNGRWTVAQLAIPPARKTTRVHRLSVQVEGGTGIDAQRAARQVMAILNDPRGWLGHRGNSFELVANPRQAEFTIYLASPGRTQKMCPLDVRMTWSCRSGEKVILNTDRWLYMTPTYSDLGAYRSYMVNHEVGHYIGFGHLGCPGAGKPAPVMMQQSKGTNGCVANPWPTSQELGRG